MTQSTYLEAFEFIENIIISCRTSFHFEAAGNLIELFKKKYPNELKARGLLSDMLADKIQEMFPPYKTTAEA